MKKQVEFTVAEMEPPKSPKGPTRIKSVEGDWYSSWEPETSKFQVGGRYGVNVYSNEYNGRVGWNVTKLSNGGEVVPLGEAPAQPAQNNVVPMPMKASGDRKDVAIGMWAAAKCITWTPDWETNRDKLIQVWKAHEAAVDAVLEAPVPATQAEPESDEPIPF